LTFSAELRADWERPDHVFFMWGACHVLAHVFLELYPQSGFQAFVIYPAEGLLGKHVFVCRDQLAFDARGYRPRQKLIADFVQLQRTRSPGWEARLTEIPPPVVTAAFCRRYRHLNFHEFFADPRDRARDYLARLAPLHFPGCHRRASFASIRGRNSSRGRVSYPGSNAA
jgi:hypothetical protein